MDLQKDSGDGVASVLREEGGILPAQPPSTHQESGQSSTLDFFSFLDPDPDNTILWGERIYIQVGVLPASHSSGVKSVLLWSASLFSHLSITLMDSFYLRSCYVRVFSFIL